MGDPAPLRRRTHGGAGAGALALVKPSPPKAVAGRPGFTRAKRPRLQSPPADRWAAIQDLALAPSLLPGATSPIRNSKEPQKLNGAIDDDQEARALPFCLPQAAVTERRQFTAIASNSKVGQKRISLKSCRRARRERLEWGPSSAERLAFRSLSGSV